MVGNPVHDIMQYYHFSFLPLYGLAALAVALCLAALKNRALAGWAIAAGCIGGIAAAGQMLFIGVLADNQAPGLQPWWIQAIVMAVLCGFVIVLQIARLPDKRR